MAACRNKDAVTTAEEVRLPIACPSALCTHSAVAAVWQRGRRYAQQHCIFLLVSLLGPKGAQTQHRMLNEQNGK